ncbi:hypothetical protein J4E91_002323 [Alternaria rosae]|nr:hypothetical protein J4E91_002323 [Alternaria rosae]
MHISDWAALAIRGIWFKSSGSAVFHPDRRPSSPTRVSINIVNDNDSCGATPDQLYVRCALARSCFKSCNFGMCLRDMERGIENVGLSNVTNWTADRTVDKFCVRDWIYCNQIVYKQDCGYPDSDGVCWLIVGFGRTYRGCSRRSGDWDVARRVSDRWSRIPVPITPSEEKTIQSNDSSTTAACTQ